MRLFYLSFLSFFWIDGGGGVVVAVAAVVVFFFGIVGVSERVVACAFLYVILLLLFALVSSSYSMIRIDSFAQHMLIVYVSYIVDRLVICDLIGSSNEQLHDSCVISEFHFYHTIDVVVFFVGVSIPSCMHISLNLRTNSQKLWIHSFLL